MQEQKEVVAGFDPGGMTGNKFGWCICEVEIGQLTILDRGRAANAQDALERVLAGLPHDARVVATGIDAPMFWTNTGEREVDEIIRNAGRQAQCPDRQHLLDVGVKWCPYPLSVQAINSLWGACLAQGLLLANQLQQNQRFVDVPITEAHPKALLCLLGICRPGLPNLVRGVEGIPCSTCRPPQAERDVEPRNEPCPAEDIEDAVLAAYGAWRMHLGHEGWRDLLVEEPHPVFPFNAPVSYWMPIPQ